MSRLPLLFTATAGTRAAAQLWAKTNTPGMVLLAFCTVAVCVSCYVTGLTSKN